MFFTWARTLQRLPKMTTFNPDASWRRSLLTDRRERSLRIIALGAGIHLIFGRGQRFMLRRAPRSRV
jgi:hypothetical protein